jgi:hypothetical protein
VAKHKVAGQRGGSSGGAGRKKTAKRSKKRATTKKTAGEGRRRRGKAAETATSVRTLRQKLADRGIDRSISTLQGWTKKPSWPFGKPSEQNPVDVEQVAEWSGQLRPDPKQQAEQQPEDPGDGRPPLRPDEDPDPYAPPSTAQLLELRQRNPDAWAEVIRKMEDGRSKRIENEIKLSKYVLASEAEDKRMRLISNVRTGLMRMPRHIRQQLADATDPDEVERLLTHHLQWLCNRVFGQRAADESNSNGSHDDS